MANKKYLAYDTGILLADAAAIADWPSDDIHAVLTSAAYTPAVTTDTFLQDIPGGAQIADVSMTGITLSSGAVIAGGTVTFPAVTGDPVTRLVLYRFVTDDTDSNLLVLCDTFTSGMPITPDGEDIEIGFDAAGIFQL